MAYRLSLRWRILAAFVVAGAILGPLLTAALLWTTYHLEERAVADMATRRLAQVMAEPAQFGLRELPAVPGVRMLSNFSTARFPVEMLRLPDGVHEYETPDGDAWFVALGTTPGGRYAVVEDISALEQRERLTALVVAGGTGLAMYLALWLGVYLSRRLLAPLIQLAARVSQETPGGPRPPPLAPDFANDEVGQLAAALDRQSGRMHEALRREREFSADVSHELRNPITVIQNAAELIAGEPHLTEVGRRAALRIRSASAHLDETVAVLLTLVREEHVSWPDEVVSVADCVEALLQERLPQPSGGPHLSWLAGARPELQAPRAVVDAIAGNLIRNAQQHSRGRTVQVSLEADRLVVKDDGVGLPSGAAARAPTAGSGLGLSLVQRLCARFGWTLHIESEPGEGTRVEWRFA